MAKSQQTFNKNEKEKKRLKKREDKRKKMEAKKAEKVPGQGIQFVYVDHFGNLTDTPPDPATKVKVDAESISISIPKKEDIEEEDTVRKGSVSFFDSSKGFGFIIDSENQEKYFTHISGIIDEITENDKVTFELEKGLKGMNAVKVQKI